MAGFSTGKGFSRGKGLNTHAGLSTGGGLSPPFQDDVVPGAPVNAVPPTVSGIARVGQTVACTTGTWTGDFPFTYTYQWQADSASIAGATNNSYTIVDADTAKIITCKVTATNAVDSASKESNSIGPVEGIPINVSAPVISGTPTVGGTMSASNGTWQAYPAPTYDYQWRAAGVDIVGAISRTYVPTANESGKPMSCSVAATNTEGTSARVWSAAVGPITMEPINTALPAITGTPYVGALMACDTGSWSGYPAPTYSYQWRAGGVVIDGATSATFTCTRDQLGLRLRCTVTATNSVSSANALSDQTSFVEGPMENVAAPVVSGIPTVGQLLTTTNGTWTGYPNPTYTYQWQADTVPISGATAATYVVSTAEIGKSVRCRVTAANNSGGVAANSNTVGPVTGAAAPVNTDAPVVSGSLVVGAMLTASNGVWASDTPITYAYQWERLATGAIVGATSSTYTLVSADADQELRCVVTATNDIGPTDGYSAYVGPVVDVSAPVLAIISLLADVLSLSASVTSMLYYSYETSAIPLTPSQIKTNATAPATPQSQVVLAGNNDVTLLNYPVDVSALYLQTVLEGPGGFSNAVVTSMSVPYSYSIDFKPTGNDYFTQPNAPIFDNGSGGFDPLGVWLSGFAYFNGTSWAGNILAVGNPAATTRYMEIGVNQAIARSGSPLLTPALPNPANVGWYLCTAYFERDPVVANTLIAATMLRNEEISNIVDTFANYNTTEFNVLGIGYRMKTTPEAFLATVATGFASGRGDPTALHEWLYNGGNFSRTFPDYDYDADPNGAILDHYWPGGSVTDAPMSGDAPGLADQVGTYSAWTVMGGPVWASVPPPYEASVSSATITITEIPATATTTLVVTATIPSGRVWPSGVAIDLSKVDIWASVGMGPLVAVSADVSSVDDVAIITFTLERAVYGSEVVHYAFSEGWIVSANISTVDVSGNTINNSATADPTNWPGICHGHVAWRFTLAVPAGYYSDLVPWATAGVSIAEEYPARTTISGLSVHGAMVNPARTSTGAPGHALDERLPDQFYFAPPSLPYVLASAGDTALKVRSQQDPATNGGTASHPVFIGTYGGLHARASAPSAYEFAPPVVWLTPSTRPAGPIIDVATMVLPSYPTSAISGSKPSLSLAVSRALKFNPAPSLFGGVEAKRKMNPAGSTGADGYGVDLTGAVGGNALVMIGDDDINSRRLIARGLIQFGHQNYHEVKNRAGSITIWVADGGTNQGLALPVCMYLTYSGQTALLATVKTDVGTNELQQVELIADQAMLDAMTAANPPVSDQTPNLHAVGEYEWFKKGYDDITNPASLYDPTSVASYRNKYVSTGQMVAAQALGFINSNWDAWRGYCVWGNTTNSPPTDDMPPTWATTWERDFYNAHWAAISVIPQTVG